MSKDKNEKRAHTRVPLMVKVMEPETGKEEQCFSREISVGGIFLETTKSYPIGKSLRLLFHIPGTDREVLVMGSVARVVGAGEKNHAQGVGVSFVDMDGASEELIQDYVKKLVTIRQKLSQ